MKHRFRRARNALMGFLGAAVIGPLLIPIPPLKGVTTPKRLARPLSQFIEIQGIDVHYQSLGQGRPALLLLHGFAASVFTWRASLRPLSELGRVVAYDRPAFGLTERPIPEQHGKNPYTIESQTKLLLRLMDQLELDKTILVGHSAGGTQALYTYLNHPDRVQALILIDPAVYFGSGTPAWTKPLLRTPQLRRIGPLLARSLLLFGNSLLGLAWQDPSRIEPDALEEYALPFRTENWDRALWEYTMASRALDLDHHLSDVGVPTLVITGDHDRIVPPKRSIQLAKEIPGAELAVIPNCGHIPQEECPGPFLEAVTKFLQARCW